MASVGRELNSQLAEGGAAQKQDDLCWRNFKLWEGISPRGERMRGPGGKAMGRLTWHLTVNLNYRQVCDQSVCLWGSLTLGVRYISDKDGSGGNTAARVLQTGLLVKGKRQMEEMQRSLVKWAIEIPSPNILFVLQHLEIKQDLVFFPWVF